MVRGRYLGMCGLDPQNLLQVEPGVVLHTRWLQACAGDFQATFNTPVLQDGNTQTLRAVIGADSTDRAQRLRVDRKSTRLNSSHTVISYAVFCLKKKKKK